MPGDVFTYDAAQVVFPSGPLRPVGRVVGLHQLRGYDSDGQRYAYAKSTLRPGTYAHSWIVDAAKLAELQTFVAFTIAGGRHSFQWTDMEATARTVRLQPTEVQRVRLGPDRYRITLTMVEEVAL